MVKKSLFGEEAELPPPPDVPAYQPLTIHMAAIAGVCRLTRPEWPPDAFLEIALVKNKGPDAGSRPYHVRPLCVIASEGAVMGVALPLLGQHGWIRWDWSDGLSATYREHCITGNEGPAYWAPQGEANDADKQVR